MALKKAPDPERKQSLRSASRKNDLSANRSSSKSEDRFAVKQAVNTFTSSGQASCSDDDDGGVPLRKRMKSAEMGDGFKSVGAAHMEGPDKSVGDADPEGQEMSVADADQYDQDKSVGDAGSVKQEQDDIKLSAKHEDPTANYDIVIIETPPTVMPAVYAEEKQAEMHAELKAYWLEWFQRIMEASILNDNVCYESVGRFHNFG